MLRDNNWQTMTIDELFEVHELMQDVLIERLKAKKAKIESQLKMLNQPSPKKSRDLKTT